MMVVQNGETLGEASFYRLEGCRAALLASLNLLNTWPERRFRRTLSVLWWRVWALDLGRRPWKTHIRSLGPRPTARRSSWISPFLRATAPPVDTATRSCGS